jgi:thioester reductase-like protein
MRAALHEGVERIVYTSSVATLKVTSSGPSDETAAAGPEQVTGAYKRSKVVAERLVERFVAEQRDGFVGGIGISGHAQRTGRVDGFHQTAADQRRIFDKQHAQRRAAG